MQQTNERVAISGYSLEAGAPNGVPGNGTRAAENRRCFERQAKNRSLAHDLLEDLAQLSPVEPGPHIFDPARTAATPHLLAYQPQGPFDLCLGMMSERVSALRRGPDGSGGSVFDVAVLRILSAFTPEEIYFIGTDPEAARLFMATQRRWNVELGG